MDSHMRILYILLREVADWVWDSKRIPHTGAEPNESSKLCLRLVGPHQPKILHVRAASMAVHVLGGFELIFVLQPPSIFYNFYRTDRWSVWPNLSVLNLLPFLVTWLLPTNDIQQLDINLLNMKYMWFSMNSMEISGNIHIYIHNMEIFGEQRKLGLQRCLAMVFLRPKILGFPARKGWLLWGKPQWDWASHWYFEIFSEKIYIYII